MRTICAVLLLAGVVAASGKAYDGIEVTVTEVSLNAHGVRFIDTTESGGRSRHLLFSCNENQRSCFAPGVGEEYSVRGYAPGLYDCDNYALCSRTSRESGCASVCLREVR